MKTLRQIRKESIENIEYSIIFSERLAAVTHDLKVLIADTKEIMPIKVDMENAHRNLIKAYESMQAQNLKLANKEGAE